MKTITLEKLEQEYREAREKEDDVEPYFWLITKDSFEWFHAFKQYLMTQYGNFKILKLDRDNNISPEVCYFSVDETKYRLTEYLCKLESTISDEPIKKLLTDGKNIITALGNNKENEKEEI